MFNNGKILTLKVINKLFISPFKNKKRRKLFLQNNDVVLKDIKNVLSKAGIPFWLEFGTLLGAIREKDFIAHDLDIDIGMPMSYHTQELVNILERNGFKLKRRITVSDGYALEETYERCGVDIDIFYFYEKNGKYVCHAFSSAPGKNWKETISEFGGLLVREHQFPLTSARRVEIIFKGDVYYAPSDIEAHLISNYGANYMIKDKGFTYLSAYNVEVQNNKFGMVEYFE